MGKSLTPEQRNRKREIDRAYRRRKLESVNGEEFQKKRNDNNKRYRANAKAKATPRTMRMVAKRSKQRVYKCRAMKKSSILNETSQSSVTNRSVAASNREKIKCKNTIENLKKDNTKLLKKTRRLKQRVYRKNIHSKAPASSLQECNNDVTETLKSRMRTKDTLSLHFGIINELRDRKRLKKPMASVISKICKKYAIQSKRVRKSLRMDARSFRNGDHLVRKARQTHIAAKCSVEEFLCRDDNSRLTAGKKEVRNGNQIRYLTATMEMLYTKYSVEALIKMGRSTFYRLRPQYVLAPKLQNRQQCLCITCDNAQLLIDALFLRNLTATRDREALVATICCSVDNVECISRRCSNCVSRVAYDTARVIEGPIQYYQWSKTDASNPSAKRVTRCSEVVAKSQLELISLFAASMENLALHLFRVRNQYKHIKQTKETLLENEAVILCDFSQGYGEQLGTSVQSAYFGEHRQITIHQGVYYSKDRSPQCFASLSDTSTKSAAGVLAHLKWALDYVVQPHITHIHIVTDSPTSQYRNRYTLYMAFVLLQERGFTFSWIYHECGHGKGPADGVGATIKRTGDQYVAGGRTVSCAKDLQLAAHHCNILTGIVSAQDIEAFSEQKQRLINNLTEVPQIMKVHHVQCLDGRIIVRDLACSCKDACQCFNCRLWTPVQQSRPDSDATYAARSQVLKDRVKEMSCSIIDNSADGNCFFQSLADSLNGEYSADELRKKAVEELKQNPTLNGVAIDNFIDRGRSTGEYLRDLAEDKSWPDHIAIAAICRSLNIELTILSGAGAPSDRTICDSTPLPSHQTRRAVQVGHIPELHYVAIIPQQMGAATGILL